MVDFKKMFGNRIYIIAACTLMGIFGILAAMPDIDITCTDNVCDGLHCEAYCNVTNTGYISKYLYNYDDWTIDFSPDVKDFDLYVKYYGKWKFTNFTMQTRLGNVPEKRKYVFVFPKKATKEFKLVVDLKDAEKIKYTFGDLDPLLIGYKRLYENLTRKIPIYESITITKEVTCESHNISCIDKINETKSIFTGQYKIEYYNGDEIGIKVGNDIYDNPSILYNVHKNYLVEFPKETFGNRNREEFPTCRYAKEVEAGCREINLLEKEVNEIEK